MNVRKNKNASLKKTITIAAAIVFLAGLFIAGGLLFFRSFSAGLSENYEEESEYGIVYFRERFLDHKKIRDKKDNPQYDDIRETINWTLVREGVTGNSAPFAKEKNGTFRIKSDIPLEYTFVHPLSEHRMYCYTLSVSVQGKGVITLSEKNSGRQQGYTIDSSRFETVSLQLGDAETFSQSILPSIAVQGKLQVKAITLYQKKMHEDRSVCLGTVDQISSVPDMEKANYPDCFYTAVFTVKEILDGNPVQEKLQLLIPAFRSWKIDELSSVMKTGDFKIAVLPFESASTEEQAIEQVDEIESYEFTPVILIDAAESTIPALHTSGIPILEGRKYVSPYDHPVNPPLAEQFAKDSEEIIARDLAKVQSIVEQAANADSINAAFQSSWNKTQRKYDPLDSVTIWAQEKNAFFSLPKKWTFIHPRKITEQNLQALIELDRFFKLQGIRFILQIVPDYRDIAALVLNPDFQRYGDCQSAVVAKQLLENGVEAQYFSDELVGKAFQYERLFFYPNDFHPDEGGMDIMTSLAAERLGSFGDLIPKELDPQKFSRDSQDTSYGKNLKWPSNVSIGSHEAGTNVQTPHIYYDNAPILPDAQSRILIFGNSFTQAPMKANSYISYLAQKILSIASCKTMGGVSALTGLPQLFLTDCENLLKGKIVAILPISIEFLAGEGYCLTDLKLLDSNLKNADNKSFLASLPFASPRSTVFPSTLKFSYPIMREYFLNHTGIVALSQDMPEVSIAIPEGISPKHAQISVQPYSLPEYNFKAAVTIDGDFKCQLATNLNNPNWEIIHYEIPEGNNKITVRLDESNSSDDTVVFLQNVSFYE